MNVVYAPGTKIPGSIYVIKRIVNLGGSAVVYDVIDTVLSVRRALKMLDGQHGPAFERRMLREWQMLASFNHPNIVRVVAANRTADDKQLPYYVMDWLEGRDLRAALRRAEYFPIERALSVASGMVAGLQAAHERGILHRDVKPENVFLHRVSVWDEVKLLDFGCARWMDQPSSDGLVGTLKYVAPEVLDGERPSERADLYSAGVTLYEMLTGRHPFENIPIRARRGLPEPLPEAMGAPDELNQLIADALAPSPQARIGSARAFAARLADVEHCWVQHRDLFATTDVDASVDDKFPSTLRMPNAPRAPDNTDVDPPSSSRMR